MGINVNLITETGDITLITMTDDDPKVSSLVQKVQAALGIPPQLQVLLHNGVPLNLTNATQPLAQLGIVQDDMIVVQVNRQQQQQQQQQQQRGPANVNDRIEQLRLQIIADPALMRQMTMQNAELAQSAQNNPVRFREMFLQIEQMRREQERLAEQEALALDADPFNVEAQLKIEQAIRHQNIAQNMEYAQEYHPESFARVIMLYIDCEVNGVPVKAFVDSGAQQTIISPDCAEACKIMHLLDARFSGIAQGVGTAKILGRIHSAQMKIGSQFLPCSFTVLEGKGVDLLFGLDMLKRHQACIDLGKNVLRINSQEVPFLSEHELPEKARWDGVTEQQSPSKAAGSSSSSGGQTLAGASSAAAVPTAAKAPVAAAASAALSRQSNAAPSNLTVSNPSSSAPGSAAQPPAQLNWPEESIKTLTDLGFARSEAIQALTLCKGNTEMAANMLFS